MRPSSDKGSAEYAGKAPNPYRVGSKEWYLEERRAAGLPVLDREALKRRLASAREAALDAHIDRDELPDLAGVGRRKGTREQPPIWVLALILVGCACLVVVTEVLGHWFSRSQWRSFLPHDVEL